MSVLHYEQVGNRREYIGPAVDAVLCYWLAGIHEEQLKEWWTTDDAPDVALELVHVVVQALHERGMVIASRRDGCSVCGSVQGTSEVPPMSADETVEIPAGTIELAVSELHPDYLRVDRDDLEELVREVLEVVLEPAGMTGHGLTSRPRFTLRGVVA